MRCPHCGNEIAVAVYVPEPEAEKPPPSWPGLKALPVADKEKEDDEFASQYAGEKKGWG